MVAGKVRIAMGMQKSPATANSKLDTPPSQKQQPPPSSTVSSANKSSQKSSFSRSFGVYFPRSSAQVQPRPPDVAELLRLVEELRERESRLKTELLEHKLLKESVAILPVLENEITAKETEIEKSTKRIEGLEAENERLTKELELWKAEFEEERRENERKTKELELLKAEFEEEKRESERKTEELELLKAEFDEEGRKSERKIKALEDEIAESKKTTLDSGSDKAESVESDELSSTHRFQGLMEVSVRSNLIKSLGKAVSFDQGGNQKPLESGLDSKREVVESERPRHSSCNSEELAEASESTESVLTNVRSRAPRVPKPPPRPLSSSPPSSSNRSRDASENNVGTEQAAIPQAPPPPPPMKQVRAPLPPPPPPPPPKAASQVVPPPPPPPPKGSKAIPAKVRRVPEVVEFYHSLMRRDSQYRRDSTSGAIEVPATANARDMIGEIENRSAHLLAIKSDVETQGDFIRYLIKEVEGAAFTDIQDVVSFVKWLDDELSYLVDERAVLKHFDWPEQKADALREAAFGYCDLKKLESEASSFRDDPRQPCGPALKKMQALLEKIEHGVYNISRMRESAGNRYKVFQIPVDWMLDSGNVSQIKLASVKLAMKYMKRVSAELETVGGGPEEEELIVQGVRFAFRVHQFAGGFDVETMRAFQELRDKARSCHVQCHSQQQKFLCRSTTC